MPVFVHAQVVLFSSDSILHMKPAAVTVQSYSGLHGFYKRYISSQDGTGCTFYPSCSNYAKEAVGKNGFFLGFFLAADRLCRCNGHNAEFYEFDEEREKPIDHP